LIWLHAEAPRKPALGATCNGCGVCCAAEPCPLGMLLSLKCRGACRLLRWDATGQRYACGALGEATSSSAWGWVSRWRQRLVTRWIAAGQGCDSSLEAQSPV
jgi:hypothetical protein